METALVAGTPSSSCSANFNSSSIFLTSPPIFPQKLPNLCQGLSIPQVKNTTNLVNFKFKSGASRRVLGLDITAKTAGASNTIEAEVDKPLGLTLGQKPGGGVVVTAVEGGGNAAKAGLKTGDQVLYTSSFFGDELWPADKLGFTKTAIQAKPDSVYFVISRGGADVDVKRLPKRPAPPRFGRKLAEAQNLGIPSKILSMSLFYNVAHLQARATHICLDCGYIYTVQKPFDEQADSYVCPQCQAPKKRFARYDVNTGKAIGGGLPPIGVIIGLVVGIGELP